MPDRITGTGILFPLPMLTDSMEKTKCVGEQAGKNQMIHVTFFRFLRHFNRTIWKDAITIYEI